MRQLTHLTIQMTTQKISKLPMRQLTRPLDNGDGITFSKLPMRQLTVGTKVFKV